MQIFKKSEETKAKFFNKTTNLKDLLAQSLSDTHLSENILIEECEKKENEKIKIQE